MPYNREIVVMNKLLESQCIMILKQTMLMKKVQLFQLFFNEILVL